MVIFDPANQQYVNVPEPMRIRVPFLSKHVPAGDAIAAATQAIGIQPCQPCEERKRRLNQRVVFSPWGT